MKALIFLVATAVALDVRAQPHDPGADYVLDTWQTDSGLPHNAITAVLQTWDGYLWVGTSNGLARFDGVRFTTFRSPETPGLRNNRITALYEDAYGALWIGTEGGGIACFHSGQFSAFGTEEGLSSGTVLCFGEDQAGRLWIGTDSGLNVMQAGRFTTFYKTDGLPDDRITAICQPKGQPLLFQTAHGICQFRREAFAPFLSGLSSAIQTNLSFLQSDLHGQLWAGGKAGLFHLARTTENDNPTPAQAHPGPVSAIITREKSSLWFGTTTGELWRMLVLSKAEVIAKFQAPVTSVFEDREGNLWIGTAGEGLRRLKHRILRLVPWPGDRISSIFVSPAGELHVLTPDNRLYTFQGNHFVSRGHLPLPEGVRVRTVCQKGADEFWVGTASDGLFQCSPSRCRQFSERAGISDSAVEVLAGDGNDGLWIGTRNGGLNQLRDSAFSRFNTPWGFLGNCASVLERDRQGNLWIGTTGDGLFCLRGGQFVSYTEQSSAVPGNYIHALHADEEGWLWIGSDEGLCALEDNGVKLQRKGNLFSGEAVLQLDSDGEGNLWVGTANRICRLQKEQLQAVTGQPTRLINVVSYGKEDGLPGIQCLSRVHLSPHARRAGPVCFATTRGLVLVQQYGAAWNREPPPVLLEAFYVGGSSVSLSEPLRLPPSRGSLRFEFTALSLTAPGKVQFRYRLHGFDTDWSEPGTGREARYPQVPPGNYRFQVIACNNDGVWNETGASLPISISAFWWETGWFQFTAGLALAGSVAGIYLMRRARRMEIEKLRLRIASDLHDDIGSSLWSITLLSRMLTKHGKLGPEEHQDVEEIHRIAVQTSNSIRDIIWLINPAFDTLQDLILRTQDFAGTALRGVEYKIDCDPSILSQKLPFDLRHNLFLLFKEALANVGRHAYATGLDVRIEPAGRGLRVMIRDNGRGFDPAATTNGHGLRNLRARAAKMGAVLQIQSQPGAGTVLVLSPNVDGVPLPPPHEACPAAPERKE